MNKFYGPVGYSITSEKLVEDLDTGEMIHTSVWETKIVERQYSGDVINNRVKRGSANSVNSDINISKSISIVADPFAYQNFMNMAYVEWQGIKWEITNIEPQYPRLIIDIGGIYNVNEKET